MSLGPCPELNVPGTMSSAMPAAMPVQADAMQVSAVTVQDNTCDVYDNRTLGAVAWMHFGFMLCFGSHGPYPEPLTLRVHAMFWFAPWGHAHCQGQGTPGMLGLG